MVQQVKTLDQPKTAKAQKISDTLAATRLRRSSMTIKTFTVKVVKSKLNPETKHHLDRLPIEAKWLYNHLIMSKNIDLFNFTLTGLKEVPVKVGDVFEIRSIEHLSSQIAQSVLDVAKQDVRSLKKLNEYNKEHNKPLGKLQPKSQGKTIYLKQPGHTYDLRLPDKLDKLDKTKIFRPRPVLKRFLETRIKVQGIRQLLRVRGLGQIPTGSELTEAKLLEKHGDYYLKITCYLPRPKAQSKHNLTPIPRPVSTTRPVTTKSPNTKPNKPLTIPVLGFDLGMATPLTLTIRQLDLSDPSNPQLVKSDKPPVGIKIKYEVRQPKSLGRLQKATDTIEAVAGRKRALTKKRKKKPKRKYKNRPPIKPKPKKPKGKKKTRYSRAHKKAQIRYQKAHTHLVNKKKDIRNKLVSVLTGLFPIICFQKDPIKSWQSSGRRGWGAKIQAITLGGLIADLIRKFGSHTLSKVDPFFASTKTCYRCKNKKKSMALDQRVYHCDLCNWVCDRDLNAALNILEEGLRVLNLIGHNPDLVLTEREELSELVDLLSSFTSKFIGSDYAWGDETAVVRLQACLNNISGVEASLVREPRNFAEMGGHGFARDYVL